jgi:biopolymer transport protein TolR
MGMPNPKNRGPVSEINVTPLVDVMLVLLVIFMISAPLLFSGVNLNLPKTKKVNSLKLTKKQTILSVTKNGELFLGKEKVSRENVFKSIIEAFKANASDTLYIRADYSLEYGSVADLMADLKRAGIEKISLVTEIK